MSGDLGWDRRLPAGGAGEEHSRQKEERDAKACGLVQATPPRAQLPHGELRVIAASCHGLGSGFSNVVSVGAEHRPGVIITTVVIVSTLRGGATPAPLGVRWGAGHGQGRGDQGARLEGGE